MDEFTLDASELESPGGDTGPRTWPAVRFGDAWNGWATPVVTREVLVSILEAVSERTGEPHRWDGDTAIVTGPVDGPDGASEFEDRLEPDAGGSYDLGLLGWTWSRVP